MKRQFLIIAAVLSGAVLLLAAGSGCSLLPWWTIRKNIENSRNLRVGMTKEEVKAIMGEPIRDEKFCEPDIWFYYNEMVWGDGLTTEDECLPLIFENGRLIGWGNDFRIDYRLKRKNDKPTLNPDQEEKKP